MGVFSLLVFDAHAMDSACTVAGGDNHGPLATRTALRERTHWPAIARVNDAVAGRCNPDMRGSAAPTTLAEH